MKNGKKERMTGGRKEKSKEETNQNGGRNDRNNGGKTESMIKRRTKSHGMKEVLHDSVRQGERNDGRKRGTKKTDKKMQGRSERWITRMVGDGGKPRNNENNKKQGEMSKKCIK